MTELIDIPRSVVTALDCELDKARDICKDLNGMDKVRAVKVGFELVMDHGLPKVVDTLKNEFPDLKVIYDAQKAGTDIPDMGKPFAKRCAYAGVDAAIIFPQAGPCTQYAFTRALADEGICVLVGGKMTHSFYSGADSDYTGADVRRLFPEQQHNWIFVLTQAGLSNPIGYLRDDAPDDMYKLGARMGVTNFVMPGNKPNDIERYRKLVQANGIAVPDIFSPGLVAQGGEITESAEKAGERWHAIVGRAITEAKDYRRAVEELTSKL